MPTKMESADDHLVAAAVDVDHCRCPGVASSNVPVTSVSLMCRVVEVLARRDRAATDCVTGRAVDRERRSVTLTVTSYCARQRMQIEPKATLCAQTDIETQLDC